LEAVVIHYQEVLGVVEEEDVFLMVENQLSKEITVYEKFITK